MKRSRQFLCLILAILLCLFLCSARADSPGKTKLRLLIIPKFEIGEMTGDFPGEAQLFYERYCLGCPETEIPHMPPTGHFYMNGETGVGILVTGAGKTAAGLSLMALLSSGFFDYSDTYLISVGCAGGSATTCMLGDMIVVTSVCDYDLGHHVDAHERTNSSSRIMWFPDNDFAEYEYKMLNDALCETVYEMIKDCPLRTTEVARTVMAEMFPARTEEDLLPTVRMGTTLTGDNYWKGIYGHVTANFIATYYGCPDPYSSTEMEEIAIANTADCFDLLDRLISLRVIVNMDMFMEGETPESTWGEYTSFNEKVESQNAETLDIFEPAMYNLLDAASIVIDAILKGEF